MDSRLTQNFSVEQTCLLDDTHSSSKESSPERTFSTSSTSSVDATSSIMKFQRVKSSIKTGVRGLGSLTESIEPAKKLLQLSSHSIESLRLGRKGYKCKKHFLENSKDLTSDESIDSTDQETFDLALDRELVNPDLQTACGFNLSRNVWYFGQLGVVNGYRRNICQRFAPEDYRGTLVACINEHGNVSYSVTYRTGDVVFVGEIPYYQGKYCLDFSNENAPKFSCVKYLIAQLIHDKVMFRVTFDWLVTNLLI